MKLSAFLITVVFSFLNLVVCYTESDVYYLNHGSKFKFDPSKYPSNRRFQIYCYEGKSKSFLNIWQSVLLQINHDTDNYIQYDGNDPDLVKKEYLAHRSSWSFNIFSWKNKQLKLNPFNQSCIGIESNDPYNINFNIIRVDYWKVLFLVSGILIFLSAHKLCQNTIFYYLCGVTLGIFASFLVLFYFLSKLFPKKPMMYGVMATGWTVSIYMFQLIWDNLRVIFSTYQTYLIWYTIASGIISFIICYLRGPFENERSQNLIKWSLQIASCFLIFCSSHYQEAALAEIIVLLIFYNLPKSWLGKPKTYWKRKFPPKVQVLTNDEYYEQGVRETNKALDELRNYCSSPECNQWKTALKLKDVKRFASFIEGNSHLSDDEILEYETSILPGDVTDDDDEEMLTD